MIKILCDEEKAAMLFDSATRIYPEAIAAIAARSNYRARAVGPSLYRAKAANSERFWHSSSRSTGMGDREKQQSSIVSKSSWLLWRAKFRENLGSDNVR